MSKEFFCDLWCCNYRHSKNYQNCSEPLRDCQYRNLFFEYENYKILSGSIFKDWGSDEEINIWEKL